MKVLCDAKKEDHIEIDVYGDGALCIEISESSGGDRRSDTSCIYLRDVAKLTQIRNEIDSFIRSQVVAHSLTVDEYRAELNLLNAYYDEHEQSLRDVQRFEGLKGVVFQVAKFFKSKVTK